MAREKVKAALEAKREFCRQHIQRWRASGLSQARYCRQHALKLHRFIYWKKKFPTASAGAPLATVRVDLPAGLGNPLRSETRVSRLRLTVGGRAIEVGRDFDPVALRQLVHVLERL